MISRPPQEATNEVVLDALKEWTQKVAPDEVLILTYGIANERK